MEWFWNGMVQVMIRKWNGLNKFFKRINVSTNLKIYSKQLKELLFVCAGKQSDSLGKDFISNFQIN